MHSLLVSDTCWAYASGSTYNDTITCQPGGQIPRTGNVMAGLITYRDSSDWREYLQNELLEPMIPGKLYRVQLYVSLADNSGFSSNNLGIYFSKESELSAESGVFASTPQIEFKNIISEDQIWLELDTIVLASGQWKYMTIGNFKITIQPMSRKILAVVGHTITLTMYLSLFLNLRQRFLRSSLQMEMESTIGSDRFYLSQ